MTLKLRSPSFEDNSAIPARYTCDGENFSPPLVWSDAPVGTKSFALIVDDPDAPDPKAPKLTWVHWVLYNLPPQTTGLPENVEHIPEGAKSGINDWKALGYGGPCPPIGEHRYFHKLYALDSLLAISGIPTKSVLEKAMLGHILAQAELVGTYKKRAKL